MAGVISEGQVSLLPFEPGEYALPVYIAITQSEQILIGEAARKQAVTNPRYTLNSIIRYLGQNLSLQRIKEEFRRLPYSINTSSRGEQYITTPSGKNYHFGQIVAKLIAVVKSKAESHFKVTLSNAIVAVPPMISHNRKNAIRNAFHHAKLDLDDWIDTPVAAGIAHAFQKGKNRILAVVDLGAGALKIAIIQIKGPRSVEVITSFATEELSGEEYDYRLVEWIKTLCKQKAIIPDVLDSSINVRLKEESEKCKRELSKHERILVDIPYLFFDKKNKPCHLREYIYQKDYERLIADLNTQVIQNLKQTIRAAHLLPKDIEEVLVLGGQANTPSLLTQISGFTKEWTVSRGLDHLVVMGAALKSQTSFTSSLSSHQRQVKKIGRLPPGFILSRRFEIAACIGQGSFSFIYEVKDRTDNRVWALKIMRPEFRNDDDVYSRFLTAAKLALKVNHPNVISFQEIIDNEEITAIKMELMIGWTLEEFLKSERFTRMPFEGQLNLAVGIVNGMIGLKHCNLYHGDLKPENVWVTKQGIPILFDFGLARYANGEPIVPTKVTGTPRYMSPEHLFQQSPFGDWSEIYSLGLILYRCFTSDFPHKVSDPKQEYLIFDFSEAEPIEPCKVNPKLPKKLGDFIFKCIKRRRGERFQTFEEVLQELLLLKTELKGTLISG